MKMAFILERCSIVALSLMLLSGVAESAQPNPLTEAAQLYQAGKYGDALKAYDKVIKEKRDPWEQEAQYWKGKCHLGLKQYDKAAECWQKLLRQNSGSEKEDDATLELANMNAFTLNRPGEALKYYDRLLKEYPRSGLKEKGTYERCCVLYMKGDYGIAKTDLEEYLKKYAGGAYSAQAQEWLARCVKAMQSVLDKNAKREIEPAKTAKLEKPAKTPEATETKPKDNFKSAIGTERWDDNLKKADAMLERGECEEALKFYREARNNLSKMNTGYDRTTYSMGKCYAGLCKEEAALDCWKEILRLPKLKINTAYADDSLLAMAEVYLESFGDDDKALECCQRLVEEYPASDCLPKAEALIGMIYYYRGAPDAAKAIFERETKGKPKLEGPPTENERLAELCSRDLKNWTLWNRSNKWNRLGDLQFTRSAYQKAIKFYKKAIAEGKEGDAVAYAEMQIGRCYNQMGRYQEALSCYGQFLKKYEASTWADEVLIRAGVIYVGRKNDLKSGEKMYRTVLEKYPRSNMADMALYHMATLSFWTQDWPKALEEHELLLKAYPQSRYVDFIKKKRLPEIKMALLQKAESKAK